MATRDTCIFHRNFYDHSMGLSSEERVIFFDSIFSYCFNDTIDSGINEHKNVLSLLLKMIPIIDVDVKNREENIRGRNVAI